MKIMKMTMMITMFISKVMSKMVNAMLNRMTNSHKHQVSVKTRAPFSNVKLPVISNLSVTSTIALSIALLLMTNVSYANDITENFPSSDSNAALYYQMGGGRSVPAPPVQNNISVPINAKGEVGLGFSCGSFNPSTTITNSLNNFKDSIQNVSGSIMKRAMSAIVSFPMYKLAQADPKLYNVLNNNVIGAHNQFALNLKSCNEMQSEALKGDDPYNSWITVSRNNNMKHSMSFGSGDLNKAMATANKDQGNNGVPWATPGKPLGAPAGGLDQPPIMVIHDTAIAGYNVILGRNPTDISAPSKSKDNQNLLNYWGKPSDAAKWIVTIVGDQKVTTCTEKDCGKNSTPGSGLLPFVQNATTAIIKKLSNLVAHPAQVNEKSLLDVSAPGQVVSPALLQSIRQMNPNAKTNTIATLSQNIATTRVVNEALLAINVLQVGAEVPNIHAVAPAQKVIETKKQLIQQDINHIMYSVNIRRQLNSHVMSDIMQYSQQQEAKAAAVSHIGNKPALLTNGGIVKRNQTP